MIVHCYGPDTSRQTGGPNYGFVRGWAFVHPCTKVHYWLNKDEGYEALCGAQGSGIALHAGSWPTCKTCIGVLANEQTRREPSWPEPE
jgi:hypothetical protein